ncbi:TetR/AcrR family transcriptional regulator [Methylobacterium sp. P1-11]|uniref:TetR/AcrR family transcriptional regulator n=1 Tax=Methylobacterium sp. P1-11 TaxID=2024616 RepID=UPI0011F00F28|nr:TetR family transcriptional regulator [Methylobacterium sp. P1-11]KAA0121825.1 TetR/AcrR family transcriptional regulator [Methylobacterium sp. P1-11]
MDDEDPRPTARRPRADAERNRLRLLDTAKATFAEKGAAASLEEIARAAGVGVGTLYRHFPTRDALIEAVYRNETAHLAEAAERLTATRSPTEALREWMLVFVDYMATKQGMSEALNATADGPASLYAASGAQIKQAMAMLCDRAVAAGEIQLDMEPLDLLRAVASVTSSGPDRRQSAMRLVDILVTGLEKSGRDEAGRSIAARAKGAPRQQSRRSTP